MEKGKEKLKPRFFTLFRMTTGALSSGSNDPFWGSSVFICVHLWLINPVILSKKGKVINHPQPLLWKERRQIPLTPFKKGEY